jgi:alkaline phosphatase
MRIGRLLTLVVGVAVLVAALGASPATAGKPPRPTAAPKNVILFIGDGMAAEEIELGRRMLGSSLWVDQIPWGAKGTLATDSLDGVTDSAAGATALASGVETHNSWLGMVPTADGAAVSVETALERAEDRGKATGLISDSYINDATPAGFAAHVTSRGLYREIATQMAAQGIEFLMGGGLGQAQLDPLLGQPGVSYVSSASELDAYVAGGGAGPVYGFFASWSMTYNIDREEEGGLAEPTLPQMTSAAISTLSGDPDGFFLMVEGGLIDWGGHARDAAMLGREMIELDQAVKVAYDWANGRSDTLVLVTADHETGALSVNTKTDVAGLNAQTASIDFVWGQISVNGAPVAGTVATYLGITRLSAAERALIDAYGEQGIADVVSARRKVTWGWSAPDEGEHTLTPVPIYALGPKAGDFSGTAYDNERVGQLLLSYFA